MNKFILKLTYTENGTAKTVTESNEDLSFVILEKNNIVEVKLNAKKKLTIENATLETSYIFRDDSLFFSNGFQSWTDTRECGKRDKLTDIGVLGKTIIGKKMGLRWVGDYTFTEYSARHGVFHSASYTYVRNGSVYDLFGAITEKNGYMTIYGDMTENKLNFVKDVEGVEFLGETVLMSIAVISGGYDEVFDKYFDMMKIKPITTNKIKGYTSWYNYYSHINEQCITRDLDALAKVTSDINVFQIDDGYQTKVGEWLSLNAEKFPNGLEPIVTKIHKNKLKAGLWLAPFGIQRTSEMVKTHSDWLIKNEKGKPICVGANWGGFYAIDIYNKEARAYLKKVFNTVLNEWKFDLVKLDFLYAAAILPRNGKSRGEIMYDAMDFIRECVGDKKEILACGVQMMPCFGKVEFMRIGADMGLCWKHTLQRKMSHREDVSTPNALGNSLYRRHLNGRAFLCDPDVFLLRDYNIKFTFEQRKLLAKVIKLFGGVLFTSDDVSRYNAEQLACMRETFKESEMKVIDVNRIGNIAVINYIENGVEAEIRFNIVTGV